MIQNFFLLFMSRDKLIKFSILLSAFFLFLFVACQFNFLIGWDYLLHAEYLIAFLKAGSFPIPFGYQFFVWTISGFSSELDLLLQASKLAFFVLIFLKFFAGYLFIGQRLAGAFFSNSSYKQFFLFSFLSVLLLLPSPIYDLSGYFYIGRIGISIWHNPTTMAVAPFVILLFMVTPTFLANPKKDYWKIIVLGILNLAIKPSFLFAYVPGVFLFSLINKELRKNWIAVFLPLFLLGVLIIVQYIIIYFLGSLDEVVYEGQVSGVVIAPMKAWIHLLRLGQTNLLLSLITSLAFPFLFFCLYNFKKEIDVFSKLALMIFISSLLFGVFFAESGPRMGHGNFLWTMVLSNMILFYSVFINFLLIQKKQNKLDLKGVLLFVVFLLHVFSGLGYLLNIFVTKSYL